MSSVRRGFLNNASFQPASPSRSLTSSELRHDIHYPRKIDSQVWSAKCQSVVRVCVSLFQQYGFTQPDQVLLFWSSFVGMIDLVILVSFSICGLDTPLMQLCIHAEVNEYARLPTIRRIVLVN